MKADQMFDMSGQVGIVTGGASGIGLAMAEVIAEHGAHVTLMDMNPERVENEVARLRKAGFAVDGMVVDVAKFDDLKRAIDDVAAKGGRLDVVFANAGSGGGVGALMPGGGIEALALEDYHKVIDVNQNGAFATAKFAAQHMIPRKYGRIILTSSVAGLFAEGASYAYGASKAAVAHLVTSLSRQLGPYNILVNGIAPGPFFTNIGDGRLHTHPEVVKMFAEMVPLGRMAMPEEMKGLALLLASPASSFITGTVVMIDGGTSQMRLF